MAFEEKTPAQLEALTEKELAGYFAKKSQYDSERVSELEVKNTALSGKVEELSKFTDSQKELIDKNSAQLRAQAEKLATKSNIITGTGDWILEGLIANKKGLEALRNKERTRFDITPTRQKAVGDMLVSTNISDVSLLPVPDVENRLTRIQRRRPWISSIISTGTTSSDKFQYHDQSGVEGDAGTTAEGTTKNQMDFDITVSTRNVEKYTGYIRVSDEMLDDIGFMRTEIQNELLERLRLKVDADQLSGDGTNKLFGLLTDATAFAAGDFALAIPEPNNIDVLSVAMNQIMLANFMPSAILMNPTDVTAIKVAKASDGHYLERLLVTADGMSLDGVPIIENTGMPAGTFLVMDASKPTLYERSAVSLRFGLNGNDFIQNMQTVLAEWRGVQVVRTNHKPALVTGTFAAAITALTKP